MPTLTIRNLSQEAHDALRRRAAENRRSMEAEARSLIEAVKPALAPSPENLRAIREMQEDARVLFGGKTSGVVDQFLKDRAAEWGE